MTSSTLHVNLSREAAAQLERCGNLDTGRTKDYLRINMFLEAGAVNMRSLNAVLKRHGLAKKWKENEYRFKV
ncbi:MAG: hypothetical protein H0T92_23730 [Pyrinomonadaceae bacterium]|nr:hypothetical protein [Pyrinomonadaceae bacterium]